ncbi:hypothetical protein DENSPDRAFT_634201 [Dentipellis sp. KUC8613]|nr:hypothetical protein DENSPDRAFT_634201 [Dentipellis sp. KUC8613]
MPTQIFSLAVKIALCETLLFGMYSILFFVSGYVLLFKRSYSKKSLLMLAAILVMYSASAIHWAISMAILLSSLRDNSTPSLVLMNQSEWLAIVYLPSVNYFLSDIIVIWRAWLICERNTRLFLLPLLCSAGVIVLIIVSIAFEPSPARAGYGSGFVISMDTLIASFGLTILSNLWVTSLTAWKAWKYRRFIRSQFVEGSTRTNSEKVLALLVESGALYLCIWVAYLTVFLTDTDASAIFDGAIIQLVGIYPTIIIVLVCFSMTETDTPETHTPNKLSAIHFTAYTQNTVSSVEPSVSCERRRSTVVAAFYPENVSANVSADLQIKFHEDCV